MVGRRLLARRRVPRGSAFAGRRTRGDARGHRVQQLECVRVHRPRTRSRCRGCGRCLQAVRWRADGCEGTRRSGGLARHRSLGAVARPGGHTHGHDGAAPARRRWCGGGRPDHVQRVRRRQPHSHVVARCDAQPMAARTHAGWQQRRRRGIRRRWLGHARHRRGRRRQHPHPRGLHRSCRVEVHLRAHSAGTACEVRQPHRHQGMRVTFGARHRAMVRRGERVRCPRSAQPAQGARVGSRAGHSPRCVARCSRCVRPQLGQRAGIAGDVGPSAGGRRRTSAAHRHAGGGRCRHLATPDGFGVVGERQLGDRGAAARPVAPVRRRPHPRDPFRAQRHQRCVQLGGARQDRTPPLGGQRSHGAHLRPDGRRRLRHHRQQPRRRLRRRGPVARRVRRGRGRREQQRSPHLPGNPAISIPAGTIDGLPVGLQVVSRHFTEQLLLDLALTVERNRPWPLVAPGAPR